MPAAGGPCAPLTNQPYTTVNAEALRVCFSVPWNSGQVTFTFLNNNNPALIFLYTFTKLP